MKMIFNNFLLLALLTGCSTRGYVNYLVDPQVHVPESLEETESKSQQTMASAKENIKVSINNGESLTEIEVPVTSSGQIILIEPKSQKVPSPGQKGPSLQPPVPHPDDAVHRSLHQAYIQKGLKENADAPQVSLSQARSRMEQAIRVGKYTEALTYAEFALARYPSQIAFLRAKGSILLLLGEKEEAIRSYEKAQEIEYSPAVAKKIEELSKS